MLAKLTDKDGDTIWINPIHVRSVVIGTGLLGGHKGTQIMMSSDTLHGHRIYVKESPSVAAAKLNEAMPLSLPSDLSMLDDDHRHPEDPPQSNA